MPEDEYRAWQSKQKSANTPPTFTTHTAVIASYSVPKAKPPLEDTEQAALIAWLRAREFATMQHRMADIGLGLQQEN